MKYPILLALAVTATGLAAARADDKPKGDEYAFLVGCGQYDPEQLRPLKYPNNDVIAFAHVLRDAGWPDDHIVLLHDDQKGDLRPQGRNIRARLKDLLAQAAADDFVVVALSGHGVQYKGEKDCYFCPSDAKLDDKETLLSLAALYKQMEECKARRKLLLVDACRKDPGKGPPRVELASKTRPQEVAVPTGIAVLFSCDAGQESFEDPVLQHGVFFHHVLQGWEGDANPDGAVTLDDLLHYVRTETPKYVQDQFQVDQTPAFRGEYSGKWVLGEGRASSTGQAGVLVWKFQKGRRFYQQMDTESTQKITVSGMEQQQTQSQTFYFRWETLGKDEDGDWRIRQRVDGVKMSLMIGGQKIDFDSAATPQAGDNPLRSFFGTMNGSEFTFTIRVPKGQPVRIEKIEGVKEFRDKLSASNGEMKRLLERILTDETMKQMGDPTFGALPNRIVPVGDAWATRTSLDLGPIGQYEILYKYKYAGKTTVGDRELDEIRIEDADLTYHPPKDGGDGLPFQITGGKLSTTRASGKLLFDPQAGRLDQCSMTLEIAGDLDIDIAGTASKVKLTQKQTTTTRTSDRSLLK